MWNGTVNGWFSRTLLHGIPTWLQRMLVAYGDRAGLWNNYIPTDRLQKGAEQKVYDLANCGPMNRFVVRNSEGVPLLVHNCVLAKQYGAGAGKIHQTLTLQGVDISFDEVKAISDGYDQTFAVLKNFGRDLEEEWRERGGWVLNGVGRPITVSEKYLKDLTNRVVQSTGHDIHVKCIRIFRNVMKRHQIPFTWVICDFHDQAIIECRKEDAPRIKDLISTEVVDMLNQELDGLIPIKYDPQIVRSMAEAKVENWKEPEEEDDIEGCPSKGSPKEEAR